VETSRPSVRIVGRYALYGTIAAGGMATVHFGRLLGPVGFSRTVAIKRLHPQFASDPEFVSMFLDEARLAARIRHPHVVPTLDVVATNGELFLVMDYVPGESLSRLIRAARDSNARIPINMVIAIMSGVLQGLHAAHEAHNERGEPLGIVHRDVSPQNVLVGSDGQARVLDFGVAKAAGRVQTTREGQLKGKLAYMAPEQLRGEPLTRKTDIYAASVVLWEALCCERLFAGDNEGAVVTRVLSGEVTPPSQKLIDIQRTLGTEVMRSFERLDAVVLRGLSLDPAHRFDTAREMALALEKCFTPATSAEISEWVEGVASPVLLQRAEQVAEIEISSSSIPRPDPKTGGLHPDLAPIMDHGATRIAAISPPGPPDDDPTFHSPTQVSSISVAANAPFSIAPPSRGRRRLVILAAAAAVGVSLTAFVFARHGSGVAAGGTPSTPSSMPSVNASVSPSLEPSPAPVAAAGESPSSPSAAPVTSAPAATTTTARPTSPPPLPAKRTGTVARPNNDCNPPYTWDPEGRKHYKANCL
jgi:serine/threonine protein kinase